jgi:hypothetical protein
MKIFEIVQAKGGSKGVEPSNVNYKSSTLTPVNIPAEDLKKLGLSGPHIGYLCTKCDGTGRSKTTADGQIRGNLKQGDRLNPGNICSHCNGDKYVHMKPGSMTKSSPDEYVEDLKNKKTEKETIFSEKHSELYNMAKSLMLTKANAMKASISCEVNPFYSNYRDIGVSYMEKIKNGTFNRDDATGLRKDYAQKDADKTAMRNKEGEGKFSTKPLTKKTGPDKTTSASLTPSAGRNKHHGRYGQY